MTDTTNPPPSNADVQRDLAAARNVSGREWHQTATRLVGAGARLTGADQRLYEAMEGSLRASGVSGHTEPAPSSDDRSAAAKAHDDVFFGPAGKDGHEQQYRILTPQEEIGSPTWPQLDTALREGAGALGYSPDAGSKFAEGMVAAATQLRDPNTRAAIVDGWQRTLQAAHGSKLPEMQKAVDAALSLMAATPGGARLVSSAKEIGLINEPHTWARLYARGRFLTTWRDTRPA
jgi:hypothetical protein